MKLDVIIPVLNEEEILIEYQDYYQRLKKKCNIIFIDGGSYDKTISIAEKYGKVLTSLPGRSLQKNIGAFASQSPYLLFLHVDCKIPDEAIQATIRVLKNGFVGGCYQLMIKDRANIFRLYEKIINFRAKTLKIIDGDCGFFIRREIFDNIGGFDDIPVCEDLEISRKLRRYKEIAILNTPITVSSRKWHKQGFLNTFIQYTLAYVYLWTGFTFKGKQVEYKQI